MIKRVQQNVCARTCISSWYPFFERTVRDRKQKYKVLDYFILDDDFFIRFLISQLI